MDASVSQPGSNTVSRPAPELCVVVPVFRGRDKVEGAVERLRTALAGRSWEVVFVDDNSPDGTAAAVHAVAATDPRVRGMRRVGRSGLAQTCLAAMLASGARHVAMMEFDAGFDERLLAAMFERLEQGDVDLVAASRLRHQGMRGVTSRWLSATARGLFSIPLNDPTSTLFMIRRDALEALTPTLSSQGYHVLLDLVVTARGRLRTAEIAADLGDGVRGESRSQLALELPALLIAKLTNDAVSIRFLSFCLVGLSGVGVHLAILDLALLATRLFTTAQTMATIGAMIWNFTLNNAVTYRDQRLTGWGYIGGLIRFQIICGIGAVSNVGVASWIYANDSSWWVAGLGGALMGAVWNYAVSAVFVWRPR